MADDHWSVLDGTFILPKFALFFGTDHRHADIETLWILPAKLDWFVVSRADNTIRICFYYSCASQIWTLRSLIGISPLVFSLIGWDIFLKTIITLSAHSVKSLMMLSFRNVLLLFPPGIFRIVSIFGLLPQRTRTAAWFLLLWRNRHVHNFACRLCVCARALVLLITRDFHYLTQRHTATYYLIKQLVNCTN